MIDYSKIRVLLADGKDRQILPMSRALKKLGCSVTTINGFKLDLGYASRFPDRKILDPSTVDDPQSMLRAIEAEIMDGSYDLVVPTSDPTAEQLSLNIERLSQYAYIAVPEPEVFYKAFDKLNTMKLCMDNSIPCPKTLFGVSSEEEILKSGIMFPIIIKPRKSFGSIGFRRIDTKEKLAEYCSEKGADLKSSVIQEYIPQSDIQYETFVFMDNESNIKSFLVFSKNRWYPVDGGSSTLNIASHRPDIIESCEKLLKIMDWRGCADIDLIFDPRDNVAKILEVNPRASGSVKICFETGIDVTKQIIELSKGEPVTSYREPEPGLRLRCLLTDILWFIESKNRFRSKPSWFSFKNTRDQIFSVHDIWPGITYPILALVIFRKEMAKRRRVY